MTTTSLGTLPILVEALARELPADRLVVDREVLQSISHDEAEWATVGRAAVAVRARDESDVRAAVRIAAELGTAIVPRGAGTGSPAGRTRWTTAWSWTSPG